MRNIIVIGASAGGIPAVKKLVSGFDRTMDASFFVVQHIARDSNAQSIIDIFQKQTSLVCHVAVHGMPIEPGHLYLAPPDHHLVLNDKQIVVTPGAHENKYRPSIDVLFRSAAVVFRNKVIGIILTGMLEDGTSGMSAIRRCGGICMVQDPNDAQFLSMPQSVLNNIEVDYRADLAEIPGKVEEILNMPLPPEVAVPKELQIEADITKRMMSNIEDLKNMADRSDFVCPECGGGLWAVKNDPAHRYRCYTGHVYSEKILQESQREKLEESVWVSIRMLEEKANLLKVMNARPEPNPRSINYKRRIDETEGHVARLKTLLKDLASQ
jgi:two-component system, chemotaxis family, protein-glutamate methylesterase/glutaminase